MSEVITLNKPSQDSSVLWAPRSGDAVGHLRRLLLDKKELPDAASWQRVEASATDILSRCLPPTSKTVGSRTGLVVGYVQSGKTISMTSVASLARDNGFGLVIVLAGTTDNLLDQSWKRFKKYLQEDSGPRRSWYMLSSAKRELERNADGLRTSISSWKSGSPEQRRASSLVVAMKQHAHLDQLADVLRHANAREVPTLVIDDEADQAGLNTNPTGVPSTTYSRIRNVRAALGVHSYLQYTATPQAPLLISIADNLSPDFSTVLEAGEAYTGGRVFFQEKLAELVRPIPAGDLFTAGSPPSEPPDSLMNALRVFFVGVALGAYDEKSAGGNRSMLVHPSPQQGDHSEYYKWVENACQRWKDAFRIPSSDPDAADLRDEFQPAFDELSRAGAESLPSFETLHPHLGYALDTTLVHRVNSETGTEVEWKNAYAHVLVGGQKLNRGYTVEGLTVTYMPRSAGTWTADTIQQLARFFGYKRGYLSLCRAYLNPDLIQVFQSYVEHEEDLRRQLKAHPGPLQAWTRTLYMDARLSPTRAKVRSDPIYRIDPSSWLIQSSPFDDAILDVNRRQVDALRKRLNPQLQAHPLAPKRHLQVELDLGELMEDLLFGYRVVGDHDEAAFFSGRYVLAQLLRRDPQSRVSLVFMGSAKRSAKGAEIVKLHQGYDRKTAGAAYPGAGAIFDPALATVQVFDLDVQVDGTSQEIKNVPTLALKLPQSAVPSGLLFQPNSVPNANA